VGHSSYVGPEILGNVQPPLSQRNKRENINLQSRCLVCIVVSCLVCIVVSCLVCIVVVVLCVLLLVVLCVLL